MSTKESKKEKAREVIDILQEISVLLNTNLDRTQLSLCVSLMENGVNPEALATAINQLRDESAKLQGAAGAGAGGSNVGGQQQAKSGVSE